MVQEGFHDVNPPKYEVGELLFSNLLMPCSLRVWRCNYIFVVRVSDMKAVLNLS